MLPPTTCTTSKEKGHRTLPMTCMEEIFWTPRGVAHVARKAPVLPTCMRANHFLYIYIYIYIYIRVILYVHLNEHNNSEKSLWPILVFWL
jgi:hypothetical protein